MRADQDGARHGGQRRRPALLRRRRLQPALPGRHRQRPLHRRHDPHEGEEHAPRSRRQMRVHEGVQQQERGDEDHGRDPLAVLSVQNGHVADGLHGEAGLERVHARR